jgi:thioredoxin reductase (NADPH)
MDDQMRYDVIVVGGGFAGISAAIFTAAWNLKTLVLEAKTPPDLWSYPRRGFLGTMSGAELIQRLVDEAKSCGVEIRTGKRAVDLEMGEEKIVKTSEKSYACNALILATGSRCKFLGVPGESWLARGVSYCAICDGVFFKECEVIVVGSKDVAVREALTLSQIPCNVRLITNSRKLDAEGFLVNELRRRKVKIMENYRIEAIEHGKMGINVKLLNMKTEETGSLEADGIFIALGVEPSALKVEKIGVKTHRQGGILVDSRQQTNVEGVFAAGDCTCGSGYNLTSCLGDGVKAGLAAFLYVKRLRRGSR